MSIGQPLLWLPNNPVKKLFLKNKSKKSLGLKKAKVATKIALGVFCLSFFLLDYQPIFGFPPLKKHNPALAQSAPPSQTPTVSSKEAPFQFQLPHTGYLSTPFSSYHPGIDIATGLGMPIKPIAPGVVVDEGYNFWGLGLNVVIDHGQGYRSTYAHMGKIYVSKGQTVSASDFLGEVGLTGHTTGPHTHLELSKDQVNIDPLTLLPPLRTQPEAADFVPLTTLANQPTYLTPVPTPAPKKEAALPKLDLSNQIRLSL